MAYTSYDRDKLEAADTMRIERTVYFESDKADISALTTLPLEQLQTMHEESAATEQAIFASLQKQAAAWEEQAGKTLELKKAIEYARMPEAEHTNNQWKDEEHRHVRSNRVYKMDYHIYENTRYDKSAQKSIPYSWSLTWSVRTNSPGDTRQVHIAGQNRKVFADKAAMEKYLNGRIKAHDHFFTEISPPIPQDYAQAFKVNGELLPGYVIEGEQPKQPEQTATMPENIKPRKEREHLNEQFSILIDSHSRFETGEPGGAWLSMPATQEQLHAAMQSVGITTDNPQDFFINGFANTEDCPFVVPLAVIQSGSMDELNYLGKLLEMQSDEDKGKFTAAVTHGEYAGNLKDLINLAQNLDCYWLYPTVHNEDEYGHYIIDELDELELPEEAKKYFMYEEYGHDAVNSDKGKFTEQGYVYNNENTFSEWYNGRDIPKEYRIMSYPQPERLDPEKVDMDAIGTGKTATHTAEPPQPLPVIPINLTAEKPTEKLKEITDRLEQGITELFDSDRYKQYLSVMSKFHNYSFNNTLLIAMQKPDASLIAGFNAWKNNFKRNVVKGQKGIKIIAPSPFKIKQEMDKIDPHTQKPMIGRDGKPLTEEKEITIPAFKVVSVFDVSQTEGQEIPTIGVNELTGDVEQYRAFFTALEKTSPVPVAFEKIESGAHGYYHLEDKRIAIDEGMSELQTLKTAIHEIAHAKLHDIDLSAPLDEQNRVDRRTREVEAESVAYTVCQHYGLDTSDYSFGYVAGWSSGKELAELKGSLETIRSTAAELINTIDGHIAEIQKEQEQTAAQEQPMTQAEPDKDTFTIYQLKRGDETRDLRFEPYDRLQATGHTLDPANYDLIYTAPLTPDMTLGGIWERFNIDHPKDFKGHSLSISDVVVLHQNGQDAAHYVDRGGYTQVPEFLQPVQQPPLTPEDCKTGEKIKTPRGTFSLTDMTHEQMKEAGYGFHHQSDDGKYHIMANGTQAFAIAAQQPENHLKTAELSTEQNGNMIDGIINNTPTVGELEQKVKAGETISLVDLANAMKADKERGKEEKPSIRAQLKAAKEEQKQKKPAKQKSQDLERS